jgi:hypothetical protein
METACVLDSIGRPAAGPHCDIYFGYQSFLRRPFSLLRRFQLDGDGSVHRHFEKTTPWLTLTYLTEVRPINRSGTCAAAFPVFKMKQTTGE